MRRDDRSLAMLAFGSEKEIPHYLPPIPIRTGRRVGRSGLGGLLGFCFYDGCRGEGDALWHDDAEAAVRVAADDGAEFVDQAEVRGAADF